MLDHGFHHEGYVLVVGAAGIDVKARPNQPIASETHNLGRVRNSVGGVARNIAENLARLEVETVLLSAVGRDAPGRRVLRYCTEHDIDCAHVRRIAGERTGSTVSLLKPNGSLSLAISDYDIMDYVDADYLHGHEAYFRDAALIVIDATLPDEALAAVFDMADQHNVRVCADPTSPELAERLCSYIDHLFLITPNSAETGALCGLPKRAYTRDEAIDAARSLVTLGAEIAVVTLGANGLAYAHSGGTGYIRAHNTKVVDTTGAGDAFSSAVIFGLLNEVPIDEAMRLGAAAATLTLQTRETVSRKLSQELLYERLVV